MERISGCHFGLVSDVPVFAQVRIENTNRCPYRCGSCVTMCSREQQQRLLGVMSIDDLELVLNRMQCPFSEI